MANYLYVLDHPAQTPTVTVGKPEVRFVWTPAQNKHVFTPCSDAIFNATALQLQKQTEQNGVIAGVW